MTYDQIKKAVIVKSNRPDLSKEIDIAIALALSNYHTMDFFWRDKKSVILHKTNLNSNTFTIQLSSYRRVRAVQNLCVEGRLRDTIPPLDLNLKQQNYYQLNSDSITVTSSYAANKFVLTYYQTPELAPIPKSWLMDLYPMQVVDSALLNLYLDQRDISQADRYRVIVGAAREARGSHMHQIWTDQLNQNAII